jgi:hypothetical protein
MKMSVTIFLLRGALHKFAKAVGYISHTWALAVCTLTWPMGKCHLNLAEKYTIFSEPHKENELPDFLGNNYSVVKGKSHIHNSYVHPVLGFTDRLLPEFKHTLNVRIRLPFNDLDSSRNLLKKVKATYTA